MTIYRKSKADNTILFLACTPRPEWVIVDPIYLLGPMSVPVRTVHVYAIRKINLNSGGEMMLRKIFAVLLVSALSFATFTGCHSMGEVTGEAAEGVEEGAEEFEEGYEEGKDE